MKNGIRQRGMRLLFNIGDYLNKPFRRYSRNMTGIGTGISKKENGMKTWKQGFIGIIAAIIGIAFVLAFVGCDSLNGNDNGNDGNDNSADGSRFDPRPLRLTTPVGNQGNSLACWAFGALHAAEHLILKQTGAVYSFSPQHLRFATSRTNTSQTNFNRHPGDGVGVTNAIAYLMKDGVVLESDIPFAAALPQDREHPLPNNFNTVQHLFRMTGYVWIPAGFDNINRIKAAIIEYGGVITFLAGAGTYDPGKNPNFYNPATFARYYNAKGGASSGSHVVLLVGWDDNFPKENFKMQPPANGAWLFKNSYGTGNNWRAGDKGYTWLSYHDESWLKRTSFAFTGFDAITANEKIVAHYDYAVASNTYISTTNTRRRLLVANVYEISAQDAVDYQISKITFYGRADHRYNIHIIPAPSDGSLPAVDSELWGQPLASNIVIPSMSDRGWITAPLDRPYSFPVAGKYIVMIDTYRVSETNSTRFDRAYGSAFGELDEGAVCVNENCTGSCPDCPVAVPGYRAVTPSIEEGMSFRYSWSDRRWDDLYNVGTIDEATDIRRHGTLLMQLVLQGR